MPLTVEDLQERRQDLIATPHDFLRRTLLDATHVGVPKVAGRPVSQTVQLFLFESREGDGTRPGSILGVHSRHRHAAENLMIQCGDPNMIAGGGGAVHPVGHAGHNPNIQFNAHWIGTMFYPAPIDGEDPPDFPWYTLPNEDGPDLMFTQRLTGCCFLHRTAPGGLGTQVAHIMPTVGAETGAELETRLRAFFAGQNVTFYGRSRYQQGRQTTIVGARNANGQWQFFAQKRDTGAGALGRAMRSVNQF